MDDALVVRRGEAARDLRARYSIALRSGSAPPVETLAQRLAVEQLRDDEGDAVVAAPTS